jgi:hypothetical protein
VHRTGAQAALTRRLKLAPSWRHRRLTYRYELTFAPKTLENVYAFSVCCSLIINYCALAFPLQLVVLNMAANASIWCPSGGNWYACTTGTLFAGCCAVNPCSVTCSTRDLYPVYFDPSVYDTFPDMSCRSAFNSYKCTGEDAFSGCCKSNPCVQRSRCPDGELAPSYMLEPEQVKIFGDPSFINITAPPVTTSLVALAPGPERTFTPVYNDHELGRLRVIILLSISTAAMLALCTFVTLWLAWRHLSSSGRHTYVSVES